MDDGYRLRLGGICPDPESSSIIHQWMDLISRNQLRARVRDLQLDRSGTGLRFELLAETDREGWLE